MTELLIVIPCRNEEKYIGKCLDSIINQGYDHSKLKVVVCDGLSDDETPQIIAKYESDCDFIHRITNKHQTTQYALNLGIESYDSTYFMILGGHAVLGPNFLNKIMVNFERDDKIGCVGGLVKNIFENETSAIIGKAMSSSFGVGNAHFRTGGKSGFVDTVAFGIYKRSVAEQSDFLMKTLCETRMMNTILGYLRMVIKSG